MFAVHDQTAWPTVLDERHALFLMVYGGLVLIPLRLYYLLRHCCNAVIVSLYAFGVGLRYSR